MRRAYIVTVPSGGSISCPTYRAACKLAAWLNRFGLPAGIVRWKMVRR